MAETPEKARPDGEPETYELDLDDDAPAAKPAPKPAAPDPAARKPPAAAEPATDGGEAYDIEEIEEPAKKPAPAVLRPELDPRIADADAAAPAEAAPPGAPDEAKKKAPAKRPGGRTDAAERAAAEGRAIPKAYQAEPEPEYLDPTVAASKREQARIRAAQEQAIEDARRRKRNLIIAGVALLVALVLFLWFGVLG